MNCKEFKDKVVDLFDTTIDTQTLAECKAHMDECPECKAYYEELAEAFNTLQPQETPVKPSKSKRETNHLHLWRPIAADESSSSLASNSRCSHIPFGILHRLESLVLYVCHS